MEKSPGIWMEFPYEKNVLLPIFACGNSVAFETKLKHHSSIQWVGASKPCNQAFTEGSYIPHLAPVHLVTAFASVLTPSFSCPAVSSIA